MVDVDHQISAVRRQVGTRVLEAGEARTVTISQAYDATIDDLWDACTNIERIPRWLMPITGDLKLGGHYQLEGNAGGTITACEPPSAFDATWEFGGDVSWIEVRLAAESEGRTRLRIEHIAHVDDEQWPRFGPGVVGIGWDSMLLGLALYLAGSTEVTPDKGMEWMASEEGRRFLTLSGESWRDAQIAAGADKSEAEAAAARCIAAYTGAPQPEG